jgi:hypothetical protein
MVCTALRRAALRASALRWCWEGKGKVGNTRLVRADTASPYYAGLAEVLTRAFGVPAVLAEVLRDVSEITAAYSYGSRAACHEGQTGQRPVGDIDVLSSANQIG